MFAGLLVSTIGGGLFMYGKKASRMIPLIAGLAMCLYPFVVTNPWVLWGITGALLAGLYAFRHSY